MIILSLKVAKLQTLAVHDGTWYTLKFSISTNILPNKEDSYVKVSHIILLSSIDRSLESKMDLSLIMMFIVLIWISQFLKRAQCNGINNKILRLWYYYGILLVLRTG
jgi:hypothetical protein